MKDKRKGNKKIDIPTRTTWVYDDEIGWININLFLGKIKKIIENEINNSLNKTG